MAMFQSPEWMNPEESKRLRNKQLVALGAAMLQGGLPTTDPRGGNLGFALSQGLQAMQGARQGGVQDILQQRQIGEHQALKEKIGQIPMSTEMAGPLMPDQVRPETPRPLGEYLTDVARTQIGAGDIGGGIQTLAGARGLQQRDASFMEKSFAPVTLINEAGEKKLAFPVFDPASGSGRLEPGQIPEGFKISTETPEEKRAAEAVAAKKKEYGKVTGKGMAERRTASIEKGIDLAGGYGNVKRARELLDTVETGGLSNVLLRAKQTFGIEAADEAELSNKLSKTVLGQLRQTFGAAFTEQEGLRLERIEGSFGKSTEGNKRLLDQALLVIEGAARRGIKAAEQVGDTESANEIRELLKTSLAPKEAAPQKDFDFEYVPGQGLR